MPCDHKICIQKSRFNMKSASPWIFVSIIHIAYCSEPEKYNCMDHPKTAPRIECCKFAFNSINCYCYESHDRLFEAPH